MAKSQHALFEAFHQDHALLGAGFFELSNCLRSRDVIGAKAAAARLNVDAGAHIAFEEQCFYPALSQLPEYNVEPLFEEHRLGRNVITTILALGPGQTFMDDERLDLLCWSEAMEAHIAECGALFEAMSRMPVSQQDDLYNALVEWRRRRPAWLDLDNAADV